MRKALIGFLGLMSACQGPSTISLRADRPTDGRDVDIEFRIYRLRDDARFLKVSVDDLWTRDKEILGADQIGEPTAAILFANDSGQVLRTIQLGVLPPEVRFVGVFALLAKERDGPRKIVLSRSELGSVIRVTGYHLEVEK